MYEENELEQIRIKKIRAMLENAVKQKSPLNKHPLIVTDSNLSGIISANE